MGDAEQGAHVVTSDVESIVHFTAEPIEDEDEDGSLVAFTVIRYIQTWPARAARPTQEVRDWVIEIPATDVGDVLAEVVGLLGYYAERPPRDPPHPEPARLLRLIPAADPGSPTIQS
jgi:hypothetical protein